MVVVGLGLSLLEPIQSIEPKHRPDPALAQTRVEEYFLLLTNLYQQLKWGLTAEACKAAVRARDLGWMYTIWVVQG